MTETAQKPTVTVFCSVNDQAERKVEVTPDEFANLFGFAPSLDELTYYQVKATIQKSEILNTVEGNKPVVYFD